MASYSILLKPSVEKDYRVIYGVDTEANQVIVHHVRHRRDAYRHP